MSGAPSIWTDDLKAELRRLWDAGLSTQDIGKRLGITKNAAIGAAHRLALATRGSPIVRHRPADAMRAVVAAKIAEGRAYHIIALETRVSLYWVNKIRGELEATRTQAPRRSASPLSDKLLPDAPKPVMLPPPAVVKPAAILTFASSRERCLHLSGKDKPWIRCERTVNRAGSPYCQKHYNLCYMPAVNRARSGEREYEAVSVR